jgi:nucleotide-binding universal stress UspA family protein
MKHILLAYDGEGPARRALDTAIDLAKGRDVDVTVVSVVPFRLGRDLEDAWADDADHADALIEATDALQAQGIPAKVLEPWGDPAATIERIADEGHYDTIVIGSRNLGPVERFLRGSVSEHVATHAEATVVVAR